MKRVFIAGAKGMVGRAIAKKLSHLELITPSRDQLDVTDPLAVRRFLRAERPDTIVVAAAKVGGIWANQTYPADFLYQNLMIATTLIHEAHLADIDRLLYLGSTCIYPKLAEQPIQEEALLSGPLEPTNEAYAIAKIAGLKLAQFYAKQYGRRYISAMPTNLYGPNDNYHPKESHVIPALLRRFHEAKEEGKKEVVIWGSGRAKREFLYVDDLAEALVLLLNKYEGLTPINVGSQEEVTLKELAEKIKRVVGYEGELLYDLSKPEGTPRKKCATYKLSELGWEATTSLDEGLSLTFADFTLNNSKMRL